MALSISQVIISRDYHDGNNNDCVVVTSVTPLGIEVSFNSGSSWITMTSGAFGDANDWRAPSNFDWNTTNATGFTGDVWIRETGQTAVIEKYKIKGYVYAMGTQLDGITFIVKQNGASNVDVTIQTESGLNGQDGSSTTLNGVAPNYVYPRPVQIAVWNFSNIVPSNVAYTFAKSPYTQTLSFDSNVFPANQTAAPVISNVTIYSNTTSVSGTSVANATIAVKAGASQIGTTTADGSGSWTAIISAQSSGVIITATATASPSTESVASTSKTVQAAVLPQTAAPAITTTTIYTNTTTLSGTAENGSSIDVLAGSTSIGTASANGSGAWTVTIAAQASGVIITAKATASGKTQSVASSPVTVTTQAVTATPTIQTNPVLTTTTAILGTAVANAGIGVYLNGVLLVSGATTASGTGNYSATIPVQSAGVKITVRATTSGSLISLASSEITVTAVSSASSSNSSVTADTPITPDLPKPDYTNWIIGAVVLFVVIGLVAYFGNKK